jgi:hypothetical protein
MSKMKLSNVATKRQEMFPVLERFVENKYLWVSEAFVNNIAAVHIAVPYRLIDELSLCKTLTRRMSNQDICNDLLGGIEQIMSKVVCPSQLWQAIQKQSSGSSGLLLNNEYSTICCMIGKDQTLFMVTVHWSDFFSKWIVDCRDYYGSFRCHRDDQFISN